MVRRCACGQDNRIPADKLDRVARCGACKQPLPAQAEPVALHDAASFSELVERSPLPVLVDFWAPWCGPCRMVAPELEKLARAQAGKIVVAKLDTDEVPAVAARFGIQSIPTMVLFQRGREAKRVSGAMQAPAIERAFGL
jgi:thioredoxin 2